MILVQVWLKFRMFVFQNDKFEIFSFDINSYKSQKCAIMIKTIYILVTCHSIELCQILVTCVDTFHALWSRSYTHIYAHAKLLHWELSNIPFHIHITTKINSPCFHVLSSPEKKKILLKKKEKKREKGEKGMVVKK